MAARTGRGWGGFTRQKDRRMVAIRIYALLQEACSALETSEDHAIAAYVGFAMALVEEKYGVGHDHLDIAGCD